MKNGIKIALAILFQLWLISAFAQKKDTSKLKENALNFDGIDDYVNLDILAPVLANTPEFSIEFWMKADLNNQSSSIRTSLFSINPITNNANGLLIILGGANTQEGRLMIYDENTFGTNSDFVSNIIIGDNQCHHIAYVRSGNIGTIYIDGLIVGTHTTTYILSANDLYSMGQEWDDLISTPLQSQFYNGDMDELRIWDIARTANEIQSNMNNELLGNEVGLVAYYNFNQGVAAGNNTGITTLVDNTTNTLDGTLHSFTLSGGASNWIVEPCPPAITSIDNFIAESIEVKAFPNPFSESTSLLFENELNKEYDLVIYDMLGKEVKRINNISGNNIQIHKNEIGTGIFLSCLINNKTGKCISSKKLIAQ